MTRFSFRLLATTALVSVTLTGLGGAAIAQQALTLDEIIILATMSREKAIAALAGASVLTKQQFKETSPARISELLRNRPNVWVRESNANPATAINLRGLQDYGRVAVVVDGARQNFQTSGHNANGVFYVDPALLANVDIVRGPVSNIFGSGAIGGVASFSTKDVDDVLRDGDSIGGEASGTYGTNGNFANGSLFMAARPSDVFDFVIGSSARSSGNYKDGNGNVVTNTGSNTFSTLGKLTLRPSEGQELKLGANTYAVEFPDATYSVKNSVANQNYTGKYTFKSPDNPLIDFAGTAYLTQTQMDQQSASRTRAFDIETKGFDVNNTSRFSAWNLDNTVTYGGDLFQDSVQTLDTLGSGNLFTPAGDRSVGGGFVQWKSAYSTWLEVIGAARYDAYSLQGGPLSTSLSGNRISPKLTVGVTPITGLTFYGTYAEGYRAPALSETLVGGQHPNFGPGSAFDFLPNPNLRPEIGHTLEAGINASYDNVVADGDQFRAKANIFRNNVSDYIGAESTANGVGACPASSPGHVDGCYQYVNLSNVNLTGFELEAVYDAGRWFAGISGGQTTGDAAISSDLIDLVPPAQATADVGFRFFERKLTTAVRWQHVWAKGTYAAYDLLGARIEWQPNEDVTASLIVDNLLDVYYVPYLGVASKPSPGASVKGALTVRFGAK